MPPRRNGGTKRRGGRKIEAFCNFVISGAPAHTESLRITGSARRRKTGMAATTFGAHIACVRFCGHTRALKRVWRLQGVLLYALPCSAGSSSPGNALVNSISQNVSHISLTYMKENFNINPYIRRCAGVQAAGEYFPGRTLTANGGLAYGWPKGGCALKPISAKIRQSVHRLAKRYHDYSRCESYREQFQQYCAERGLNIPWSSFRRAHALIHCNPYEFFLFKFYEKSPAEQDAYLTIWRRNCFARKIGDDQSANGTAPGNKILFNLILKDFLCREWLNLTACTAEEFARFRQKTRHGDDQARLRRLWARHSPLQLRPGMKTLSPGTRRWRAKPCWQKKCLPSTNGSTASIPPV